MHVLAILSFLFSSCSQGASTDSTAAWSVRLDTGVRVEYLLKIDRTTDLENRNDRFVTTTKSEQTLAIEPVAVNDDGTSTLACHFGPAKGTVRFDRWTMTFDSSKGIDEAKANHGETSGRSLRRVGKSVRVVVDAHGAVQKIEGLAQLYKGSDVEKELASKENPLDDSDFIEEAQSWIALLPDVVPTRGAHWTDAFTVRTTGNTRIEFQPEARVNLVSDAEIRWTFKTAAMGSASSKSKELPREKRNGVTTIELKSRSGREWTSPSALVSAASIEGSTTIRLADGLPVQRTLDWQAEIDLGGVGVPDKTKLRERMRIELVRR